MMLVTSARVVCHSRPQVAALPHVCDLVASSLAPPQSWTIEIAIHHGCTHLARHLLDDLEANPELHYLTKRSRARRCLSEAASVGDLALMEHLVERFACCVDDVAILGAVEGGHLVALQWLCERALASLTLNADVEAFTQRILPDFYMIMASRDGHLEVVQWMHNTRQRARDDLVLQGAVEYGHIGIVEWAVSTAAMPVADTLKARLTEALTVSSSLEVAEFLLSKSMLSLTSDLMDEAARNGHLELLQWMYDNDGEGCTSRAIDDAASNGHLEVVQWLHSKGLGCSTDAMHGAIDDGHLSVVKFLHENRSEGCTPASFESAVANGYLSVAQFLLEHRSGDCAAAVSINHLPWEAAFEMLKWLQTGGLDAQYTVDVMDEAAGDGRLNIVQFLHENRSEGCTTSAMDAAAARGHLEVVEFLHENRIEGCTTSAMDEAATHGHLAVVKFLHENRSEGCTTYAMDQAASKGHLNVIKFLHENRVEGCTTEAMDHAHNVEILRWLGENRHEGFTSNALTDAAERGDVERLLWLRSRSLDEMWTPTLAEAMASNGQVEALEWLADAVPDLVDDAHELLLSRDRSTWWIWAWLNRRVHA